MGRRLIAASASGAARPGGSNSQYGRLHRRLSRLQRSSASRRSRGHSLWPARHDLCLRDSGDDPDRDDGGCGLAPQGLAPAAAVSARVSIADRPIEAAMSRHLAPTGYPGSCLSPMLGMMPPGEPLWSPAVGGCNQHASHHERP
ncbi:MAG: hypothetical protein ACJ8DI_11065 [Ktedonobacteraceae bacterium]